MHSYGSGLFYGDTSGSITNEVTKVMNMDVKRASKAVDTTHLKSTAAQRTMEPGMWQCPVLTATCRFDKTMYATLYTTLIDTLGKPAVKYWKVYDADGSTLIGQGFVTNLSKKTPDDDEVDYDLEITASGAWAFTPAP